MYLKIQLVPRSKQFHPCCKKYEAIITVCCQLPTYILSRERGISRRVRKVATKDL